MKFILTLGLTLFSIFLQGQDNTQLHTEEIFETIYNDGYFYHRVIKELTEPNRAETSHLVKTDDELNIIWSYDLNDDIYNSIINIQFDSDRIFMLTRHGKKSSINQRRDDFKLILLSKNKEEECVYIFDEAGSPHTKLLIDENFVIISYVSYLSTLKVVKLNLATSEFTKSENYSFANINLFKILKVENAYYAVGSLQKDQKYFSFMTEIMGTENASLDLEHSSAYISMALQSKADNLFLTTVCNPYEFDDPSDRYFMITQYSLTGKFISSKRINFKAVGWTKHWHSYNHGDQYWQVVEKEDGDNYLEHINHRGKVIKSIRTGEKLGFMDDDAYAISDKYWFHFSKGANENQVKTMSLLD